MIIFNYIRDNWKILSVLITALVAVFNFVDWLFDNNKVWLIKELATETNWWWIYRTLSAVVTLSVLSLLLILYILYIEFRKIKIIKDISEVFNKELPKTNKIRIFASKGESAKACFISYIRKYELNGRLEVYVLLRTDGSSTRKRDLKNEVQKWKSDVDQKYCLGNCTVTSTFSIYDSPVMLSGFIFDNRSALLAWYSRKDGVHRSPPTLPYVYIHQSDAKELIDEAINTFDAHFKNGEKLN